MKRNTLLTIASLILLAAPSVTFAYFTGLRGFIADSGVLITYATRVVVALALLVFFWGLVKFIRKAGEGEVEEGKQLMIWGVIAFFVMVSIWGLVGFLQGELLPGATYSAPTLPTFGS